MRAHLFDTDYPAVRRVMGPERDVLSDDALEDMLASTFPDHEPGEIEDFMSTVQRVARDAAPIVQRVAPAMAQGATSGAAVGGPWGALIGGVGGGAASLLTAPGVVTPPPAPAPPPQAPAVPAAPPGGGPASAAAAAQLLTLLSRPETMQALLALLMGSAGRSTVTVGQRRVPATEFANAISELAAEVASSPGSAPHYYLDEEGEPRCDLFDPRARAALLWRDMAEAAVEEGALGDDEEQDDALDEGDDVYESALDTFEAALAGAHR